MASKPDALLPSAGDFMTKLALAEAEEASKEAKKLAEAQAEKRALLEQLTKPSGLSDEEAIRRAVKIIERAVSNGLTEVQVHRFPNQLCTDRGRAINQQEAGWESTLTGVPREIYELWAKYFRSRGYKLKVEILEFPGGIPGDVGMTLQWGWAEIVRLVELGDPRRNIPPCAACHRPGSGGPIETPILSEQWKEYVALQLKMYASGDRRNDVYGRMREIAAKLTPAEINGLATYYRAGFR